mgnify:CR=1 FL=1|tara:strand:- start:1685 stop:4498 length:2814 start_codon:yes stop_codon:yes gene_type:complete
MSNYPYLRFFNGVENELNLVEETSSGILKGSVHLPEVSTGLYESANIFIIEEQRDSVGNIIWGSPVSEPSNSSGTRFKFEWADTVYSSSDIFFYSTKLEEGMVKIQHLDSLAIDVLDHTNILNIDNTGLKKVSSYINNAMQINVALNSLKEGRHDRTLRIVDESDNKIIAEILIYGETVGEDERLKVLLQNFGASLDDGDFIMFKEHDIKEYGTDHILLNQKRRELLLELHNIKPFVGTYKAVLNAIDFFGYNNITLKEYWLNINQNSDSFGKLKAVPVPDVNTGFSFKKRKKFNLPSSTMKKTSRFSLVYKLNTPTGKFDEWDIPKVEETFDFTPEEVLIKLYGLKNKLQKEYLPLQAKIYDITGEGDFFDQKNLNVWNNQQPIVFLNEGKVVDFEMFPKNKQLYIESYALVNDSDVLITSTGHGRVELDEFGSLNNAQHENEILINDFEKFYDEYYSVSKNVWNDNLFGHYDIPVGAPLILECTSLPQSWDDAKFTFNDCKDPHVIWDNWWHQHVYEIEWEIEGPRDYKQTFRGPIGYWESDGVAAPNETLTFHPEFLKIAVMVPFEGSYSVTCKLIDLYGFTSHYKKNNMFDVKIKPLDLYGIYQWKDDYDWNGWKVEWGKSGGYWDMATKNKDRVQDSFESLYLTMDRANYLHDLSQGKRFSMVRRYIDLDPTNPTGYLETSGPYEWESMETVSWNDGKHNWWNATRVGMDLTSSFKITRIYQGNQLIINHMNPTTNLVETGIHVIQSPSPNIANQSLDLAAWQAIADELNASTDPVISKFNYNPVYEDTDNDDYNDVHHFLLCVGKNYSLHNDFIDVELDSGTSVYNGAVMGEVHHVAYNPTFDTVRIINGSAEVERSTHVTISYDKSEIPGVRKMTWKIFNDTNPNFNDIYYDNMWLTYVFKNPGAYRIALEVEDTNGNKKATERNMIFVK